MDLDNRTLEVWLEKAPKESYPLEKVIDYYSLYKKLKDYLSANIHKEVTVGANLHKQDELLNDHGIGHIEKVIEKASKLVECKDCDLRPLEVYLLLCAIQLHDVGNIFGRDEHENKMQEIMLKANEACGRDDIERTLIRKIAQAHGGELRGVRDSKDKIGQTLGAKETLLEGEVRPQAIASVLRLADELADDKSRANITLLNEGNIPKKSEIFHAYASCLESVSLRHDENSVELQFHVPKKFTLKKFGKLDKEVYLLDEIYTRVMKMNLERIYCMRYCKKLIDIEQIVVRITFYSNFMDDNVFPPISFTLCDSGYPDAHKDGIYGLCDSLLDSDGNEINGEYVRNKIDGTTVLKETGSKKFIQRLKRVFK